MPNICITLKSDSNKSCSALNWVQKSQWAHMSISPRSGAWGLKTLIWLKNYNAQKRQITFTLGVNGMNAGENTYYMEKTFK